MAPDPRPDTPPGSAAALLWAAHREKRERRRFATLFPHSLFRHSAWDMMLELFIATEQGERLCVKELTFLSGESATGAMRRIDQLEAMALLHRRLDDRDHRRTLVHLTGAGRSLVAAMMQEKLAMFGTTSGGNQLLSAD